jgi:hypothetical protein
MKLSMIRPTAFAVVLAMLVVAGCGGHQSAGKTVTKTVSSSVGQAAAAPRAANVYPDDANCQVYAVDGGESIYVYTPNTDPEPVCRQLVKNLSGSSSYWREGIRDTTNASRICDMESPTSSAELQVYDTGGAFRGTSTCGELAQKGWNDRASD